VEGHSTEKRNFGYRRYRSMEKLTQAVETLYECEILPAVSQGLAAAVYTQLSDVEEELNGFVTYDRAVEKMPAERMAKLNGKLYAAMREAAAQERK